MSSVPAKPAAAKPAAAKPGPAKPAPAKPAAAKPARGKRTRGKPARGESARAPAHAASADKAALRVIGARTHNLKGVDCRIPHGQVTVITGVSGAGKSSLAFDTIYAEAQRRFVESMSTYARQFLEQMERPPVDTIENVLPAIALEARNSVRNARSTVGTLTEVNDVLRLVFAHLGEVTCPNGHGAVRGRGPQELASELIERFEGQQITLLASLRRPSARADDKWKELVRQGYFRRFEKGEIVRMKASDRWTKKLDPLVLALGRFRPASRSRARLVTAIEEAYLLAAGRARIVTEDGTLLYFGRGLCCEVCGARMERPTPALFSFNSPLGACPTCQGFGRVIGIDRDRVIPDPSKSLDERPIAPWNSPSYQKHYAGLLRACRERGIATHVPIADLPAAEREFLWTGDGRSVGLDKFFRRLERKNYKMHVRVLLARYRAYDECPTCAGRRLRPESLAVRWHGKTMAEIGALSIETLRAWVDEHTASLVAGGQGRSARASRQSEASRLSKDGASHLLEQLADQLETLHRVGLDYLTLDRLARTLSGGESQRIQLASALGSGLTGTLYVLDEPTIGLHPRDSEKLLHLLHDLSSRGNTVVVVEHDRDLIEGADHVIDVGPRAGEHGGEVIVEGDLRAILAEDRSLTAQHLRERPWARDRQTLEAEAAELTEAVAGSERVSIEGARENNLKNISPSFPLGCLVAVTGVSGSGKSTLIENVLHGTYQRSRGVVDVEPGECDALLGLDDLADVVMVDQRPLGRSTRSNPVTYTKAYDEIRKLFASTPDAERRGITAGHFSFNLDKGRCKTCKGTGTVEVDMQFLAPVQVVCETCDGRRFEPEVLAVQVRGRNIRQTLDLTVDEALEIFSDQKKLCRKLQSLHDVGLGYLRLGQSTATLSGGEAQRLKLASFLDRRKSAGRRLFLFDEPTTGLHLADIDLLHSTFRRLIEHGHGVLVVEHATDLVARADWIVDLGPGGGVHGGELLYCGPMLGFLDRGEGPTASILRRHLSWQPAQ